LEELHKRAPLNLPTRNNRENKSQGLLNVERGKLRGISFKVLEWHCTRKWVFNGGFLNLYGLMTKHFFALLRFQFEPLIKKAQFFQLLWLV
jgi:hypothetical protein